MSWYLAVLSKYADFNGRARRKEYWMFALFQIIVYVILEVLLGVTNGSSLITILLVIYALGTLLPTLGVLIRRLHDQDKSGFWIFISLVPFIGGIWLLVLTLIEGTRGPNKFGPDPKMAVGM
jgi:uncharacterized membrane protein YhaH (DUF805 family)